MNTQDLGLAIAISNTLESGSWKESIDGVHDLVARQLTKLDAKARVSRTDYFNHTFIPDFVLSWDSADLPDRQVFLRTDPSPSGLQHDLDLIGKTSPILLALVPFDEYSGIDPLNNEDSSDDGTLVADPGSVESLSSRQTSTFGSMLPNAVVRGGRGLLNVAAADKLTSSAEQLFTGATDRDSSQTLTALDVLSRNLSGRQHKNLSHVGQVLWEVAGGDATEYPANSLGEVLGDAALEFLIASGPEHDLAFWRKVGAGLTIEKLAGLPLTEAPALQTAVTANLDRLNVRRMAVRPVQAELLADYLATWSIRGQALELTGATFAAQFAMKSEHITKKAPLSDGLSKSDFDRRVATRTVHRLGFRTSGLTVSVEADPQLDNPPSDLQGNDSIEQLAVPTAVVSDATVTVGGKSLDLDFEKSMASLHTSSQLPLNILLENALPLLRDIDSDEMSTLRDMLRANESLIQKANREASLFESDSD